MFLLAALLVSGCGKKAAVAVNGAAEMKPVDSYLTKEVREYKDEGTIETPVSTLSSDDGLCVIKVMPSYTMLPWITRKVTGRVLEKPTEL